MSIFFFERGNMDRNQKSINIRHMLMPNLMCDDHLTQTRRLESIDYQSHTNDQKSFNQSYFT